MSNTARNNNNRFGSHGFLRVRACAPPLAIADPATNATTIKQLLDQAVADQVALLLTPELSITGFTCEDLFAHQTLLTASHKALNDLAEATANKPVTLVVGAPWPTTDGRLFNCAFVLAHGRVLGAVPKTHLPNHGEFYDQRWFTSGAGVSVQLADPELGDFQLDARQLFQVGQARMALEICEDLWAPEPTGTRHALAGADLILNPSASNDLVAKADYRRDLVRMTSGQRICGYLYASAGPDESSKDLVFGGHLLACANGRLLAESERFQRSASLTVEFDLQHLAHERRWNATFASAPRPAPYPVLNAGDAPALNSLSQPVPAHPFVPDDGATLAARATEILAIQSTGLARRLASVGGAGMVLGLSGGLDSTLALLVCLKVRERWQDWGTGEPPPLHLVTLPGPATSSHTLDTAGQLAAACGLDLRSINISPAVSLHLEDIGHGGSSHDITFENAQARERTQILFNLANRLGALVVGTGDLSELALGWCTFNADHMASYNVNASVPKTLVSYLVRWYGRHHASPDLAAALQRVLATPISPELVPGVDDNTVAQLTEDLVGPYELHDFFLYHSLRHGSPPAKTALLAELAFADSYSPKTIQRWLRGFLQRFFSQQFKRTTLPPGPKVGTLSLSPRGDWRMPDEASARAWLADLDQQQEPRQP